MGIGSVKAMDGMTGRQGTAVRSADFVSKNIQDEISDVQRQKQGLSSKQEMSAVEKAKKRQELQQELSSLNTQLRQRQSEARKEQQREALLGEARSADSHVTDAEKSGNKAAVEKAGTVEKNKADSGVAEEKNINVERPEQEAVSKGIQTAEKENAEKTESEKKKSDKKDAKLEDIGIPLRDMQAIVERNASAEQTRRREAVIARMESGIVIMKGEIRQDELRGADVEKKEAELKKQEQKVQKAAVGLPDVKGPSKGTGTAAQARAGGAEEKSRAAEVRRSRDGVVIVTPNVMSNTLTDNYFR